MYVKMGRNLELIMKCLKVFYKKNERMKFKKICFMMDESPSKLLNDSFFRSLIVERVFVPEKDVSNPDQEYTVDWYRLRDLVLDSNIMELLDICGAKIIIK